MKIEHRILVAVLVCVLVAGVGISFAYFVSGVAINGDGARIHADTPDLINVSYDAGTSTINMVNAMPGTSADKDFKVTVSPSGYENTFKYAIKLDVTANTFTKCTTPTTANECLVNANELVYTLKDGSGNVLGIANSDITSASNGKLTLYTQTGTVNAATDYNYNLEISFVNTHYEQNHNMGKTFTGNVIVEFVE